MMVLAAGLGTGTQVEIARDGPDEQAGSWRFNRSYWERLRRVVCKQSLKSGNLRLNTKY